MEQSELLRVDGLKKVYRSGSSDLMLFENLSFQVHKGEMLAIVGESGSGKSSFCTSSELLIALPLVTYTSPTLVCGNSPTMSGLSSATASWDSFGSSITCYPNSPHLKTSPCPFSFAESGVGKPSRMRLSGSTKSGYPNVATIAPVSFPGVSNNVFRSPGHWSRDRRSLWLMSLQAISITVRRKQYLI